MTKVADTVLMLDRRRSELFLQAAQGLILIESVWDIECELGHEEAGSGFRFFSFPRFSVGTHHVTLFLQGV